MQNPATAVTRRRREARKASEHLSGRRTAPRMPTPRLERAVPAEEKTRAALGVPSAFFRRPPHPHFTFDHRPPEPRAGAQNHCQEERSLTAAMLGTRRLDWSARECQGALPPPRHCKGRERKARGGRAGGSTSDVLGASVAARPPHPETGRATDWVFFRVWRVPGSFVGEGLPS